MLNLRNCLAVCLLLATVAFCTTEAASATKHYIVTDDDNTNQGANTATVFVVNNSTGALTQVKVLKTGGTGMGGGYSGATRARILPSAKCVFISDSGSSDIAAFSAPAYKLVGRFSNAALVDAQFGITLAATSQYLYAGYTTSSNIGVWKINSDCSLTLANTYSTPGIPDGIAVSPNGTTLVTTFYDIGEVEVFTVSGGTLTETQTQMTTGFPAGIEFTNDGKTLILADSNIVDTQLEIYSLNHGVLSGHQYFEFTGGGADSNDVWLSPAAAAGGGFLYVTNNTGLSVTVLNFTESPLTLTLASVTPLNNPNGELFIAGGIQGELNTGTGGRVYVGVSHQYVSVLNVNSNGTLTEVPGSPFTDNQGFHLLSIAAYPPR
jgi:hypothetical protein